MRAEDVKPGMWVRDRDETFQVTGHIDDLWFRIAYLDGLSGMMERAYARRVEPWVPRVGEWVRRNEQAIHLGLAPDVGTRQVDAVRNRCAAFHGGVRDVSFDWLEPCAPPEAKPETGRRVDGGPVVVVHLAAGASVQELEETERSLAHFAGIDTSTWPQRTRDHNATCSRCGGRAYQGIGLAKCVEPVCDDPETREPDRVDEAADVRLRYGLDADGKQAVSTHEEMMFVATGRGKQGFHPTREGAIAAWRKAVRRG